MPFKIQSEDFPMQPDMPIALMEMSSKSLDISKTQREQIEASYRGVSEALCEDPALKELSPHIQPQGSVLLGTVVRPGPDLPFDVDATCLLDQNYLNVSSQSVFDSVYKALKAHGVYKDMAEPKNRCIRLNYADEKFHLDMTPCVPNSAALHAIHVPDREHRRWKPSNPQLYASLFEDVAAKHPRFTFEKRAGLVEQVALSAKIDPLPPEENFRKKLLKRIVQLLKRHRDIHFGEHDHAVISIILTTLAAKGYARLVEAKVYPNVLDFVISVVDDMPNHISATNLPNGQSFYHIPNPAIPAENFADKWNKDQAYPEAFRDWHTRISRDLGDFKRTSLAGLGNHVLMEKTAALYGKAPAQFAAREFAAATAIGHRQGELRVSPALSLGTAGVIATPTSYYGS